MELKKKELLLVNFSEFQVACVCVGFKVTLSKKKERKGLVKLVVEALLKERICQSVI